MPLFIFMLVPIVEMWILIEVGGWIGALPTIALVVLTATLGLSLLKRQGLSTLMRARRKMDLNHSRRNGSAYPLPVHNPIAFRFTAGGRSINLRYCTFFSNSRYRN